VIVYYLYCDLCYYPIHGFHDDDDDNDDDDGLWYDDDDNNSSSFSSLLLLLHRVALSIITVHPSAIIIGNCCCCIGHHSIIPLFIYFSGSKNGWSVIVVVDCCCWLLLLLLIVLPQQSHLQDFQRAIVITDSNSSPLFSYLMTRIMTTDRPTKIVSNIYNKDRMTMIISMNTVEDAKDDHWDILLLDGIILLLLPSLLHQLYTYLFEWRVRVPS